MEKALLIVVSVIGIAISLIFAAFVVWCEWVGATWLVENVLNVHDGYGYFLKILAFFLIAGVLSVLGRIGKHPGLNITDTES